jgi:transglutaminase-like putative cysteine protease
MKVVKSFTVIRRLFCHALFPCLILTLFCGMVLTGCSEADLPSPSSSVVSQSEGDNDTRDNDSAVLVPEASGKVVFNSELYSIDVSNVSRGYVMVYYQGDNEKVKLQISTPEGTPYTYLITKYNQWLTFPLPGGNGIYKIELYEVADLANDLYAVVFTQDVEVFIENEFLPFLYPNNYIDFSPQSQAVALGSDLAEGAASDLEVISNIYYYVIENISYDTEKAKNVKYGYTPDVDDTLATQKGICFDYASLMSAMLRSQGIPTKLEVGYAGEVYHAWISCYVDEIGWVDKIIQFDGVNWTLMDPTFAAGSGGSEFVGDGTNYQVKFNY